MSWLHPGLALLALLCALVPLLIFLIFFRRYDPVNWGAMEILRRAIKRQSKRTRLQDLILLAVRTALLLLLGLAIARPLLTSGAELLRTGGLHVILVDNTLSTTVQTAEGPVFEQLRAEASRLIAREPESTRVLLLPLASARVGDVSPTRDRVRLDHQLESIEPADSAGQVSRRLRQVEDALRSAAEPFKRVTVLTDGQRRNWPVEEDSVGDRLDSIQGLADLRIVYSRPDSTANVHFSWDSIEGLPATVLRPVVFRVRCHLDGLPEGQEIPVSLSVDDVIVDRRFVRDSANGDPIIEFRRRFREPGFRRIRVVTDPDGLTRDNTLPFALEVREKINVLHAGDSNTRANHLPLALEPARQDATWYTSPFRVTSVNLVTLDDRTLQEYEVAVIAQTEALSPADWDALRSYVAGGGGVLLLGASGGAVPEQWPLTFGEAQARGEDDPPFRLLLTDEGRDRLPVFRSEAMQRDLARAGAWELRPVAIRDEENVRVLWSSDSGNPLLATARIGQGRVVACGITLDPKKSDWMLRPFFAPLLHELVGWLAESRRARNLEAGEEWRLALTQEELQRELEIRDTEGVTYSLQGFAEEGGFAFPFTYQSGFYSLTGTTATDIQRLMAARPAGVESDLRYRAREDWPLPPEQVLPLAGMEEGAGTDVARAEIGPWLALAALLLALLDPLLAWWFRRPARWTAGKGGTAA